MSWFRAFMLWCPVVCAVACLLTVVVFTVLGLPFSPLLLPATLTSLVAFALQASRPR